MSTRGKFKRFVAYSLLTLLAILVYQYLVVIADPTQFAIKDGDPGIHIERGFFVDTSQQLSHQQVLENGEILHSRSFDDIPWGFEQQTYWLRLKLHNSTSQPTRVVVHFANPMLEQISIYHSDNPEYPLAVDITELGWQAESLMAKQRAFPSYEVLLAGHSQQQLVVRIATEGIAKTPIAIYWFDDFANLMQVTFLIWGSFVGILVVMSLYNLVLYSGLKDSIYLVYIGYSLSILAMLGVVIGFGHYIWPEAIIRSLRMNIVSVNLSVVIFTLSFALLFFNSLKRPSRIIRLCISYVPFLILLAIVSLFLPEYIAAPIFFLSMVVLYPLIIIFLYQQFRLNHKWARYYLVSWVPIIIGGALQPMVLTGVIKGSFLMNHSLMIGVMCEVVLMAMALASRMQYKKERALFNATHDYGTRLPNTTLLENRIAELVSEQQEFSVCLIEVADFPSLQPYISSTETDDLIVMISRAINLELVSHQGFFELEKTSQGIHKLVKVRDGLFAALIVSQQSAQQDEDYRRIQAALSQGAQVSELYIALSAYFGISSYSAHDDEKKLDVMKQAQQALDQAKREITAIARYQSNHAYSLAQRLSLAANLQQALRDNKLQLYHQPQIDLQTGLVDGSEVLLRWHHDEFGNIPPDEFISIAEDTGIVNELTLWVIERACQHLEILRQQGYEDHNVSVNISGKDIAEPGFLHNVRGILARYKISLNNLTFELTESVTVSDFHLLKQTLDELTRMGINIAIDDYGTGYSSLFYISQLPFTELKIDKSFVVDLDVSERHRTIVKTTIEMAKSLDLRLVAEGIESASIEALLREQDCHIAQGYYYQRPIPFSQYLTWLKTWRQD